MNQTVAVLSAMGATFDAMNRKHTPKRHAFTRTKRRDTLANTVPIVALYVLACWADGWSSAPLLQP